MAHEITEELQFHLELDPPKALKTNQTSGDASPKSKENRLPSFPVNHGTPFAGGPIINQQAQTFSNIQPLPEKPVTKAPHLTLSNLQNTARVNQLATSSTPLSKGPKVQIGFTPRIPPSSKAQISTNPSATQAPALVVSSLNMFRRSNFESNNPPVIVGRPSDSGFGTQLMESRFAQSAAQPVVAASSSQKPESTQSSPVGSFEDFKFSL